MDQGQGDIWEEMRVSDKSDSCLQIGKSRKSCRLALHDLRGLPLEGG